MQQNKAILIKKIIFKSNNYRVTHNFEIKKSIIYSLDSKLFLTVCNNFSCVKVALFKSYDILNNCINVTSSLLKNSRNCLRNVVYFTYTQSLSRDNYRLR